MNLAKLLQPWVSMDMPNCDILGLQHDSRQVKRGDLFFAYPGALSDGRLYVKQAIQAGASAIVYEPENVPSSGLFSDHLPCIPVLHLSQKLAAIASRFYGDPSQSLYVTGVTGTNGKTTIAYQLAQAYGLLGHRAGYVGTLGYGDVAALHPSQNTTPDALSLQKCLFEYQQGGAHHVCMEVSSHAISQHRVDHIAFEQAIYTNLTHEHLDYHHTMDEYAAAKAELFAIPSLKWAIVNQDDAYSQRMLEKTPSSCRILTYGLQEQAMVRAVHWDITMSGSELEIVSPWGTHAVRIPSLGVFNIYNSLAVFGSLLASGLPVEDVVQVMPRLRASPGRMEVVLQKPCVIVDYAHTPDALENVLSTLSQLKQARLGVVFGCGGDRDRSKRPLMGRLASQYADFVILTNDNPRHEDPSLIAQEISAGLLATISVWTVLDRKQAIHQAMDMADELDIILIAGKGHESYQQIGDERFAFSDQDVVRSYVSRVD